ncbi:hypothetical protein H0H93_003252, partial [Arthromyces matolae]
MSLPPIKKDISADPAPGSAVDTVDEKVKDADVERKMKDVIEAFRLGRLPTNKQINSALDYVLEAEHSLVATAKLSPNGKKLIKGIRSIFKTMKIMVHEKNGDELLQQFLWHTRDVETDDKEREKIPALQETMKSSSVSEAAARMEPAAEPQGDDLQPAIRHLRTLFSLVLTNSEVRKLLSDFSIIGRDVLSNQQAASETERMTGSKEYFADRLDQGKKFLTSVERKEFIYRGKKVIIECQKNGDSQEAICWLLSYVGARAATGHQKMKGREEGARGAFTGNKAFQQATYEIRTLLERFASNESMEPIIDAFRVLGDDAHSDKALKDWFEEVNEYFRQILLEPGYVLDQQCDNRAVQLRESGRKFFDGKYKGHFDRLFENIGSWFEAMEEDRVNMRFREDWARLTEDLFFDSEGGLTFKTDLWNDINHVIIPQIIGKVGYIPIPRIEYTDETLDLVIGNLTLSGHNLFPNIISMRAGERKEGPKDMKKKEDSTSISSGASHSQFRIVADRRRSILSTQGHPTGWINRTQEKSEMA